MKKQTKFMSSITIRKIIIVFFLFLLPVFAINAQPQSFFISPGRTVKNGDIVRGYCLEYTKDVLRKDNIYALARIIGDVWVTYTDGRIILTTLQALKNAEDIYFVALNSYQHLGLVFNDQNIAEITIGNNGITLLRGQMEQYEEEMANENIQKIIELEKQGVNHAFIQQKIWRKWKPEKKNQGNNVTIDFHASNIDKQVHSTFDDSSTVSHERNGKLFLRTDGILNRTVIFNEGITELNTHTHIDHMSRKALLTRLQKGDFERIISPYPILDSARTKVFEILKNVEKNQDYNFRQENKILEITKSKNKLNYIYTSTIGDFFYTVFDYDANIRVEIFKYQKPIKSNVNSDGAIYLITINKVRFLLLGDFDYPAGIENLLDASAANEIERADIEEELAELYVELYETQYTVENLKNQINKNMEMGQNINVLLLSAQYDENIENISEIKEEIKELEMEILSYPVVKADVIKYPHHAHVFEGRDQRLINKLIEAVNPYYIIYQTFNKKSIEKFDAFLNTLSPELRDKFINSAIFPVKFITLKQFKKTFNNFIRNEGEAA